MGVGVEVGGCRSLCLSPSRFYCFLILETSISDAAKRVFKFSSKMGMETENDFRK